MDLSVGGLAMLIHDFLNQRNSFTRARAALEALDGQVRVDVAQRMVRAQLW